CGASVVRRGPWAEGTRPAGILPSGRSPFAPLRHPGSETLSAPHGLDAPPNALAPTPTVGELSNHVLTPRRRPERALGRSLGGAGRGASVGGIRSRGVAEPISPGWRNRAERRVSRRQDAAGERPLDRKPPAEGPEPHGRSEAG